MEINKMSDIQGVMTAEDIVEGRFALLTQNLATNTYDFHSDDTEDLPAVKLPDTADEAAQAKFIVTWPVPYQSLPMYIPQPRLNFSLRRGGFDQSDNLPLTGTTVHLTWPGQQDGVTIPSGFLALAFGGGEFTLPSGSYVYSAAVQIPGTEMAVANSADDGDTEAGKLKASSTNPVAVVKRYYSTDGRLTVRTLQP